MIQFNGIIATVLKKDHSKTNFLLAYEYDVCILISRCDEICVTTFAFRVRNGATDQDNPCDHEE
jgi:hypothetical protein